MENKSDNVFQMTGITLRGMKEYTKIYSEREMDSPNLYLTANVQPESQRVQKPMQGSSVIHHLPQL
jgi:hypothetical protein